ncbi:hypothetical protein GCM10028773_56210 [Spirosoma koreense]
MHPGRFAKGGFIPEWHRRITGIAWSGNVIFLNERVLWHGGKGRGVRAEGMGVGRRIYRYNPVPYTLCTYPYAIDPTKMSRLIQKKPDPNQAGG